MSKIRKLVLEVIKRSCLAQLDFGNLIFFLISPVINDLVPAPFRWISEAWRNVLNFILGPD